MPHNNDITWHLHEYCNTILLLKIVFHLNTIHYCPEYYGNKCMQ